MNRFSLNSGFTKILCTPEKPLSLMKTKHLIILREKKYCDQIKDKTYIQNVKDKKLLTYE